MRLTVLSTLLFSGTALAAGSVQAAGELNLICSADVVICEQMQGDFEKAHDIKVNMVRLSSGET
ncbi:MAG TPA: iron ABC transporter substrate-binding protein, partial [Rhizobium sp.]|nr:iron ABC transporter substrate-binding protein [Rhizobium sp.]